MQLRRLLLVAASVALTAAIARAQSIDDPVQWRGIALARALATSPGLLLLDARSWLVSGFLSLALLLGFMLATAIRGTALAPWIPYVDGIALLSIGLAMLPLPLRTTWRAMREVLMVAPDELDQRVRTLMRVVLAERGFIDFSSHVAKLGRTRFVEIHVSTPLEVCESRDPKGLYSRARTGAIKHFTGVSSPYEAPENAEITLDTSKLAVQESVEKIVRYLEATGRLRN